MTPEARALLEEADDDMARMIQSLATARVKLRRALNTEPPATGVPGRGEIVLASTQLPPTSIGLAELATLDLDALWYDSGNGDLLTGLTTTWGSTNAAVFTVNGSGVLTGVGAGTAQVTAQVNSAGGQVLLTLSAQVTVSAAAVASITASPTSVSITAGGSTRQVTATPKDGSGNALAGRTLTVSSTDTGKATVSIAGYVVTVTPVAAGSCTIRITEPVSGVFVDVPCDVAAASSAHPNRPTDVTWIKAATLPLTSDAAMTTDGYTRTVGTLGTHLGTADGATFSVDASGTLLAPGPGPADPGGRIAWFKVRSAGNAQGRNSILEILGMPQSSAKSLWYDFTVWMPPNWDGHISGQCKLFWYAVSSPNGSPYEGILAAWGSQGSTPGFAPYFQGTQMDRSGIQSPRGSLTKGSWHRCQALFVPESSLGANDGLVKWFMDGVLIGQISNMDFGGLTLRLPQLQIYWGGQGDAAANDLYVCMDLADVYYATTRSAG